MLNLVYKRPGEVCSSYLNITLWATACRSIAANISTCQCSSSDLAARWSLQLQIAQEGATLLSSAAPCSMWLSPEPAQRASRSCRGRVDHLDLLKVAVSSAQRGHGGLGRLPNEVCGALAVAARGGVQAARLLPTDHAMLPAGDDLVCNQLHGQRLLSFADMINQACLLRSRVSMLIVGCISQSLEIDSKIPQDWVMHCDMRPKGTVRLTTLGCWMLEDTIVSLKPSILLLISAECSMTFTATMAPFHRPAQAHDLLAGFTCNICPSRQSRGLATLAAGRVHLNFTSLYDRRIHLRQGEWRSLRRDHDARMVQMHHMHTLRNVRLRSAERTMHCCCPCYLTVYMAVLARPACC